MKPLGRKANGSIGHLPGSRLGPADHCVPEGQAKVCTEHVRNKHDRVYVQEKLDGTCVAVAKIDGYIVAIGRKGYLASSSPFPYIQMFAKWVADPKQATRFDAILEEGERIVGEWLAMAVGTRYDFARHGIEPFVPFDIMRGERRTPTMMFYRRIAGHFAGPNILTYCEGMESIPVETAYKLFSEKNSMHALDPIEGVVYRVENRGEVDFLAKWVRPDKVDGCYLPEISQKPPVWNWPAILKDEKESQGCHTKYGSAACLCQSEARAKSVVPLSPSGDAAGST